MRRTFRYKITQIGAILAILASDARNTHICAPEMMRVRLMMQTEGITPLLTGFRHFSMLLSYFLRFRSGYFL